MDFSLNPSLNGGEVRVAHKNYIISEKFNVLNTEKKIICFFQILSSNPNIFIQSTKLSNSTFSDPFPSL